MAESFYRLGEWIVPPVVAMQGTKFTYHGLENIPARGGALLAQNHTSYLDAGRPLQPQGTTEQLNAALRQAMNALRYRVQEEYPHPGRQYWVLLRLGGSAPSQDDSRAIRLAELQERAQRYGSDGVTPPGQSQSGLH